METWPEGIRVSLQKPTPKKERNMNYLTPHNDIKIVNELKKVMHEESKNVSKENVKQK